MEQHELIGKQINRKCPRCGKDLLQNGLNDVWCSSLICDYNEDKK